MAIVERFLETGKAEGTSAIEEIAQVYGNHTADAAEFAAAYRAFRDAATLWARARLALRRMFTRSRP